MKMQKFLDILRAVNVFIDVYFKAIVVAFMCIFFLQMCLIGGSLRKIDRGVWNTQLAIERINSN